MLQGTLIKQKDPRGELGCGTQEFCFGFLVSIRSRAFSHRGGGGGDKIISLARVILLNEFYSMVGPWRTPGTSRHLSSHTVSKYQDIK